MESWGFIRQDIKAGVGILCMQQKILPLSIRLMESWGFIRPDSTRSGDPDSDAAQDAIKLFQNILN